MGHMLIIISLGGACQNEAQELAQASINLCQRFNGHVPEGELIRKIAAIGNHGNQPQNCERDLQRLIRRHGLSLPIPIEHCEVEMYDPKTQRTNTRKLPIIFPDAFAAAVFAKSEDLFKRLFLGDVDARAYWDHVEKHCSWFRDHPAKNLDVARRAKLIPLSLYGDEVQSFRNTEGGVVCVMGWSSDFGHGKPPLSRYFCICCVCEHYCTENTHKQILDHVARRVAKMCDPNQEFPWSSRGYTFAYSSTQGDLKYVSEKFGMHNFRRNDMCSRCLVRKKDPDLSMTIGDFRLNSAHVQTQLDHDAFFQLHGVAPSDFNPIFSIPGSRLERVLHDVMHSQLLGTGKSLNGSVLTYLIETGAFGAWRNGLYRLVLEEFLHVAYAEFNAWKKNKKINVTQPRFTPSRLGRLTRNSYPSLNSKAAASKTISFWLCDKAMTWGNRPNGSQLDKEVAHCLWTYCEVLRMMDECDILLCPSEGQEMFDRGMTHLQLYSDLNSKSAATRGAHDPNRACWRLLTKHHHFQHMLSDTKTTLINPRFYTLLCGESFIGVMGRISRTCHRSSLSLRSLERYILLLALHLRSQEDV